MIHRHRIFIKANDIAVLEGIEYKSGLRRMKQLRKLYNCKSPTIENFAKYHGNSEDYIVRKMVEFKLID